MRTIERTNPLAETGDTYRYDRSSPKLLFRDLRFSNDALAPGDFLSAYELPTLDGGSIQIALNANPDEPTDETSTELVLEVDDVYSTTKEMENRGIEFEVPLRPVTTEGDRTLHAKIRRASCRERV